MDDQPKTSFIPKKPIQVVDSSAPIVSTKTRKGSVFSFITTMIFLITLGVLGGVYFWKFTLQKKIENQVRAFNELKSKI